MKKLILHLFLVISSAFSIIWPNEVTTPPLELTNQEQSFLNSLYIHRKNMTSFAKQIPNDNLEFCLMVLLKNIQILENNRLPEKSWKKKLGWLATTTALSSLYGAMGYVVSHDIYMEHYDFFTGSFRNIFVSQSELKNIPSQRFTLKEKKYLKQFTYENLFINGDETWRLFGSKEATKEYLSKMSPRNKEKLTYYALKKKITSRKKSLLFYSLFPTLIIASGIGLFISGIYIAIFYDQLQQNQINICKELYKILLKEQDLRISSENHPITNPN
jgi:hypothetical protein